MGNRPPLLDDNDEVRELTEEDFAAMKPFSSLPADLQKKLRGIKSAVISVDGHKSLVPVEEDVLKEYQATGEGWQKRIDDALRAGLDKLHKKTA